jgi:hypothetical protein
VTAFHVTVAEDVVDGVEGGDEVAGEIINVNGAVDVHHVPNLIVIVAW